MIDSLHERYRNVCKFQDVTNFFSLLFKNPVRKSSTNFLSGSHISLELKVISLNSEVRDLMISWYIFVESCWSGFSTLTEFSVKLFSLASTKQCIIDNNQHFSRHNIFSLWRYPFYLSKIDECLRITSWKDWDETDDTWSDRTTRFSHVRKNSCHPSLSTITRDHYEHCGDHIPVGKNWIFPIHTDHRFYNVQLKTLCPCTWLLKKLTIIKE